MNNLDPKQSVSLAEDIYALTRFIKLEDAIDFLKIKYANAFAVSSGNILKGKTGGPGFIKSRTAFGVVLLGHGKFKGQAFFVFRGTQYLADWLTNVNVSVSASSLGQPVHDGFNESFKSMKSQLTQFKDGFGADIHTVHCIGHSLGGALATICAEWLKKTTRKDVFLYTYGSPRVGLYGFSQVCTSTLGEHAIFRVYHKTDLVPYIPIWPFLHVPFNNNGYYLYSPGVIPFKKYHDISEYRNTVGSQSWGVLKGHQTSPKNEAGIMRWLKESTPAGMTITTIEWLNDALIFVLKKCSDAAASLISRSFSATFTLMDKIAYILKKGIDLSETVSGWVVSLIEKMMSLIGMKKVVDKAKLTHEFIRNIFMRMSQKIHEYVQRILDDVLVDGRSI